MKKSLLLFLAWISQVPSVPADVTVTTPLAAPAKNIMMSFEIPDAEAVGYQWRNTPENGRRDIGMAFTPESSFLLEAITLQLQSGAGVGTKSAPFRLLVFKLDLSTRIMLDEVANLSGISPAAVSPANTFLRFDLGADKIPLKAGETYGFLFIFEDQLESRAFSMQAANENMEQPSLRRLESEDGSTLSISRAALEFYLEGTPQ